MAEITPAGDVFVSVAKRDQPHPDDGRRGDVEVAVA